MKTGQMEKCLPTKSRSKKQTTAKMCIRDRYVYALSSWSELGLGGAAGSVQGSGAQIVEMCIRDRDTYDHPSWMRRISYIEKFNFDEQLITKIAMDASYPVSCVEVQNIILHYETYFD